jgi:hypothetical protein
VNATGPDSDGDLSVEIKVSITNRSGSDWDQVNTRTQLISASGFIEETSDTHDLVIEDGATEEVEMNFYGVKARPFMANPELTKIIINVVACSASNKKLSEIVLPETSFEVVKMEPCDISDSVRLLSGGIWRTDPDNDKDVRVEAKWLVQNLTDTHLPEVKFTAEVVGKSGAEIGDAGGYEELRPSVSAVISGSTYSKEKKLKGAVVQLGARVMSPAATGSSEHIGMELTASDESVHDDESSQNGGNNAEHFSGGQPNGEIARYVRTNDDGSLICAIAYSQEVVAAWPSDSTRILGAYWGYAGGGVGYDGGFFVINGELDPEVLDFEQAEQSDESEKFNSLMAEVSKLYMGDSDAATLSEDGQALIDSSTSDGDDRVYWDSNFQGEDLGKVSQQWGINWRFDWDEINVDDAKNTEDINFVSTIKWGDADETIDIDDLPPEFAQAKALWSQKSDQSFRLLEKFLRCVFVPSNLMGDLSEILDISDDVDASSVNITGLEFSENGLPSVRASANFVLMSTPQFSKEKLSTWEDDNDRLDNAVSWQWCVSEDGDLVITSHQGVTFEFLESEAKNDEEAEKSKDQNNRIVVEWSIKRAVVNVDDVEDEDTKNALIEVIKLCKEMQYEEALAMLPEMTFEFDSDNMDSSADDYLSESVDSFVLDPNNKSHSIRVGLDGNKLILSIAVIFEMSLVSGVTAEVLDEWLSDNGGWAGATAAGQWQYSEDDGGSFASVKCNVHSESEIQQVNCRYCVDFGKYIFASEEERDAFIKDPQFIFDFQPGNVDDKKGMVRIFGSTVNISPIYKDNAPKFIITHLEKNEDNDLGVIVSVEVEMAFEIRVGIEEFSEWIDSSESTWRYSGRIECVGEDGMEDSDREEYEFNW